MLNLKHTACTFTAFYFCHKTNKKLKTGKKNKKKRGGAPYFMYEYVHVMTLSLKNKTNRKCDATD